jgi:hypothetical protein
MQYAGKTVILGMDPAHRLSGIFLKLRAFEAAMLRFPSRNNEIVLI